MIEGDLKLLIEQNIINRKHEIYNCVYYRKAYVDEYLTKYSHLVPFTNGKRQSTLFDYFHMLLCNSLKHLNDLIVNLSFYMSKLRLKTEINIISMYELFHDNKRVMLYLNSKNMIYKYGLTDKNLYSSEIDEIVDYDDVERFVTYVTVTNYDIYRKISMLYRGVTIYNDIYDLCMIKGSFKIFKYIIDVMKYKNINSRDTTELIFYGGNPEMIHFIEDDNRFEVKINDIFDIVTCTYNFNLLGYVNNTYPEVVMKRAIKDSNAVQRYIFLNHLEDIIKWYNANRYQQNALGCEYTILRYFDDILKGKLALTLASKYNKDAIELFPKKDIDSIIELICQNSTNIAERMCEMNKLRYKKRYPNYTPLQVVFLACKHEMFRYLSFNHADFIANVITKRFDHVVLRTYLRSFKDDGMIEFITHTYTNECMEALHYNLGEITYDSIMKLMQKEK